MLLDIALDHPGIELEIGDRAVAVAGLDLGAVDPHVDVDRVADEALEGRQHARAPLGLVLALDQRRGGDGAGIDHRVERAVVALVEADRVERFAGGLDADPPQHLGMAPVLQRQAVDDRLGDRLDGEARLAVAGVVAEAVRGHERDREPVRVDRRELGDVAGEVAVGEVAVARMQFVEQPLDRKPVHDRVLRRVLGPRSRPIRPARARAARFCIAIVCNLRTSAAEPGTRLPARAIRLAAYGPSRHRSRLRIGRIEGRMGPIRGRDRGAGADAGSHSRRVGDARPRSHPALVRRERSRHPGLHPRRRQAGARRRPHLLQLPARHPPLARGAAALPRADLRPRAAPRPDQRRRLDHAQRGLRHAVPGRPRRRGDPDRPLLAERAQRLHHAGCGARRRAPGRERRAAGISTSTPSRARSRPAPRPSTSTAPPTRPAG